MPGISPNLAQHRGKVAGLTRSVRNGERPQSDLIAAKRDYTEAKTADYIEKVLSSAPPLTDEQRIRLAELLRPVHAPRGAVIADKLAQLDGGAADAELGGGAA